MKKTEPIYPAKTAVKKREKFNWKPYVIIFAVIAVILGSIALKTLLIDPYSELSPQLPFEKTENGYYDRKNDRSYLPAPTYYQAASILEDPPYARIGDFSLWNIGDWDKLGHLYRVGFTVNPGTDRAQTTLSKSEAWLASDADHGLQIYYNPALVTLPEPENLDFETVYLCDGAMASQMLGSETSARIMNDFFDESAENLFDRMESIDVKVTKTVRVTSGRYPWIHLVLTFFCGEDGYYLYLPERLRLVKTDPEVFDPFFKTETPESSGGSD